MFTVAMIAVVLTMLLALIRAFLGPSIYDRILAINFAGTTTVLFIAVLGFLMGRPEFLDIALAYALINFIGTIAILKFFKYGNLGVDIRDEQAPGSKVSSEQSPQAGSPQ